MLVCGLLTGTMLVGLFEPEASLQQHFGTQMVTDQENFLVRSWSAVIGVMGLALVYGAFFPKFRRFVLALTSTSKLLFIAIGLGYGSAYLPFGLGTALAVDAIMVTGFAAYLILTRNNPHPSNNPRI
jgi:hypothetical protein